MRDYIHVSDLAQAHILAMEHLLRGGDSDIFNLGNGVGFTVKEVIDAAERVAENPFPRRLRLAAREILRSWWLPAKRRALLSWKPQIPELRKSSPRHGNGTVHIQRIRGLIRDDRTTLYSQRCTAPCLRAAVFLLYNGLGLYAPREVKWARNRCCAGKAEVRSFGEPGKKKERGAADTPRGVGRRVNCPRIFLGVCLYFETAGLIGAAITSALFGLTGLFAYALPPVLLLGGGVFISLAAKKPMKGRTALIVFAVLLMLTLLHVIVRPMLGTATFPIYVRDAYLFGTTSCSGGGALGALLCYPLLLLTGEAGTYIFLIAGLLIILLLVTSLSLRKAGQQVGVKVKEGLQYASDARAARRELYTATIDEEEPLQPRMAARAPTRRPVLNDAEDISFMPTEGPLQKKAAAPAAFAAAAASSAAASPPAAAAVRHEPVTADSAAMEEPTVTFYGDDEAEPDDFAATPLRTAQRAASCRDNKPFVAVQMQLDTEPVPMSAPAEPAAQKHEEPAPYVPPSFSLLNPSHANYGRSMESPSEKGKLLVDTLESFNVSAKIVNISVGPVITRFELAPAPGVRVNRITALSDDIALALAAPRVRIEAPIPGKAAVGIEVPNKDTATVVLRDVVESREFATAKSPITLALGKDIAGKVIVADLAKMPHLLIAGATGSGKSVCINDIIISLVYKCSPQELQLILVDPKVVELSAFGVLPHLKVPVVTDPKKAAGALSGGGREMTDRYQKFAKLGARDLERYNELQQDPLNKLPKLVIIIDELADLMMVAPDTVEDSICRIAQLGRAAGIHLIVATQRPSADVITGLIKANIPSRVAFAVASAIDSRIILDSGGAEKLLGRGDMLFHPNGAGKPVRVQGAYVSDEEVERIVKHFQSQALSPEFDEHLMDEMEEDQGAGAQGNGKQEDELLGEAVRIVLDSGQASISMIQRRLRVGYARAARLVDIMEQHGYVSGFDGSKPRKLLITRAQYEQIFTNPAGDMQMSKIGVISLGCSKNRVDTERMLGLLEAAGHTVVSEPAQAEVLIVNTCGFIEPAKQESIDTILEMAAYKDRGSCQTLVVTGCLSERYREELKKELPEVDLFLGVREYERLPGLLSGSHVCASAAARRLTTPPYSAYLRIGDGCDNRCAYCAIPLIRGPLNSVPMPALLDEARALVDGGVTELTLIAQDTSGYGVDLYGKPMLLPLMEELCKLDGLMWLRVLYTYPDTVTEELLRGMAENEKICRYLDIPLQHVDDEILRRMHRRGDRAHIERILDYIRLNYPDFILRTTMMVGFPGETDAQHEDMLRFLRDYPFDRVGAFAFSPEEDTPAALMKEQVPEEIGKRG